MVLFWTNLVYKNSEDLFLKIILKKSLELFSNQ